MGKEGIEPSWNYFHTILSRARLPVPPLAPLVYKYNIQQFTPKV